MVFPARRLLFPFIRPLIRWCRRRMRVSQWFAFRFGIASRRQAAGEVDALLSRSGLFSALALLQVRSFSELMLPSISQWFALRFGIASSPILLRTHAPQHLAVVCFALWHCFSSAIREPPVISSSPDRSPCQRLTCHFCGLASRLVCRSAALTRHGLHSIGSSPIHCWQWMPSCVLQRTDDPPLHLMRLEFRLLRRLPAEKLS